MSAAATPTKQIKYRHGISVVKTAPQAAATATNCAAPTPGACAVAARIALQPRQPRYLGEFAETAGTSATRLELAIPATTL